MSRNIDLSGIKNFRERLQKLKNISNDDIVMAVAEKGKDLAQAKYSGKGVVVTAENLGGGKARIIASGRAVAFFEYGVGVEGDGTYEGNLPNEPITFESANETHTTIGWEYYYDNPKTKTTQNGQQGWIFGKTFVTGWEAQAQMWRTANELAESEGANAVERLLKEKGV